MERYRNKIKEKIFEEAHQRISLLVSNHILI